MPALITPTAKPSVLARKIARRMGQMLGAEIQIEIFPGGKTLVASTLLGSAHELLPLGFVEQVNELGEIETAEIAPGFMAIAIPIDAIPLHRFIAVAFVVTQSSINSAALQRIARKSSCTIDELQEWIAGQSTIPVESLRILGQFVKSGLQRWLAKMSYEKGAAGLAGPRWSRSHSADDRAFLQDAVVALTSVIDAKDTYTRGHSDRVARVARLIARKIELSETAQRTIYFGGLLHDIGKVGIDNAILNKPGKLSREEFEHVKTHVKVGFQILSGMRTMRPILPIILHHHEAWDGGGYPSGLAGTDIPLAARIVAIADSYDAMQSDRPYRAGMPRDQVEKILRQGAGRQWDPDLIDVYFENRDEIARVSNYHEDFHEAVFATENYI